MTFGENESVIGEVSWVRGIIMHSALIEEKNGKDFSRGGTCGWMTEVR